MAIHLRSAEELEKMHRAGLVVHEVLQALRGIVRPGQVDGGRHAESELGKRIFGNVGLELNGTIGDNPE